jgi:flagellar basal-body rod protein FlgG
MNGAFYVGAVGLDAQQKALETIAGNISNVHTPGFKRSGVQFAEILAGRPAEGAVASGLATDPAGAGVRAEILVMLDQQGQIESTGRPMDLAVDGRGFIELMGPGGETLLWRGGALKVGEDGLLGTVQGLALKAAVAVPADASEVRIGADGVVRAVTGEGGEAVEIGQIMLVKVDDPTALRRLDGGLYAVADEARLSDAQPGEDGSGRLVQGAIERSNVELTTEMVQLMLVQRAYAANAQIVQAADQLMGIANGLKR